MKKYFISDEIDSLMGQRKGEDSGTSRTIATQLLVDLQGSRGICLVGATNTPWDIDSAFVRRFDEQFYIPLPDYEARVVLIERIIKKVPNSLLRIDIERLAKHTEGYSAADIIRIFKKASGRKTNKLQHTQYCAQTSRGVWFPCTELFPGAVDKKTLDIDDQLMPPRLSAMDFEFSMVKKTVLAKELEKFKKFEEECGM